MKQHPFYRIFSDLPRQLGRVGIAAGVITAAVLVGILTWYAASSQAFTGPTQSAGTGGGTITTEGPNLSVGTTSSPGSSRLYIVASSTSASDRSIRVIQPDGTVIFVVQNDQKVSIATSTPSGSTSTFIVAGNALITGALTATNIYGPSNGAVNAINVSAGYFGSQTGGGNYAFPASISIATSTSPSGGVLFVNGNVGIGSASPSRFLDVRTTSNASFPLKIRGDIDNNGGYTGIVFGYEADTTNYEKAAIMVRGTTGNVVPEMHFLVDGTADTSNADINDARISILPSGEVGIGDSGPSQKLQVNGNVTVSGLSNYYGFNERSDLGLFGDNNYTLSLQAPEGISINIDSNNNGTATPFSIREGGTGPTGGTALVTVLEGGGVGVGTSTPAVKLHVFGASQPEVRIQSSDNSASAIRFITNGTERGMIYAPGTANYLRFETGGSLRMTLDNSGFLGIGTSTPAYRLDVLGNGAATARFGASSGDTVDIGGGSGKLNVGTVDPIYTIGGVRYATYLPAMTGVKEETAGVWRLSCGNDGVCSKTVEFGREPKGSDLWLFAQTSDLKAHFADMAVLLSPAFEGRVWYTKDIRKQALTVYARPAGSVESAEVSYRLTAPRFDASQWSNYAPESPGAGFVLDE